MYCNNCKKQVRAGSVFCEHCGAEQLISQETPVDEQLTSPEFASKGLKNVLFCTIGAAVLAFLVFGYLQWLAPPPEVSSAWDGNGIMDQSVSENSEQGQTGQSGVSDEQKILGYWETQIEGDYVGFEFSNNGVLLYIEGGEEYFYQYSLTDGVISILHDGEEIDTIDYEFEGELLILTINGNELTLTRVDELG